MTVSSQDTIFQHVGNGVTTIFAYGCQVPTATDMEVYLDNVLQTSGYTIQGLGASTGGTVTFAVAPANLAAIRIERVIELERTTDYQQNGDFLSGVVNPDFDRLWMALQGHNSQIKRAMMFPSSDTALPNPLPPLASRANNLLGFDANGQPVAVIPSAQSAAALQLLLATNAGASMIGFDGDNLANFFKSKNERIVASFTELRALNKSLYLHAFVVGHGRYDQDTTDTTSADNGGEIIVATDGARWKFQTFKTRPSGFWTGNGSKPQRFGDRLFHGDAVAGDGYFPGTTHDWLYNYQNPFFSAAGNTPPSNSTGMVSLAGGPGSPFPGQAILGGASSAAAGAPGGNAIGVQGIGVAQSALGGDFSWGLYGEGHRATSNTGNCYGAEIAVVNRGTTKINTPYLSEVGSTIGLQVDSGVGFTAAQMSGIAKASSAIVVVENADGSIPFLNGLVFAATSIDGTDGNTGHGDAIVMAKGHRVRWYKPGNVSGPVITSDVGGAAVNTNLVFTDFGLQVQNASAQAIIQFANSANSKNGFQINTADGGGNVAIEAIGADANVSIKLTPKGTGLVQFGSFTAGSGTPNGFILVLDAAGNQRKLATIP